jgi:periplasmic divalent cation tolerance protein
MKMILSSCPPEIAQSLADKLVASRLAACVQILPLIKSVYWWKAEIHRDDESLLVIKTGDDTAPACRLIKDNHPYQVPEIVVVDIASANPDFTKWLEAICCPSGGAAFPESRGSA